MLDCSRCERLEVTCLGYATYVTGPHFFQITVGLANNCRLPWPISTVSLEPLPLLPALLPSKALIVGGYLTYTCKWAAELIGFGLRLLTCRQLTGSQYWSVPIKLLPVITVASYYKLAMDLPNARKPNKHNSLKTIFSNRRAHLFTSKWIYVFFFLAIYLSWNIDAAQQLRYWRSLVCPNSTVTATKSRNKESVEAARCLTWTIIPHPYVKVCQNSRSNAIGYFSLWKQSYICSTRR